MLKRLAEDERSTHRRSPIMTAPFDLEETDRRVRLEDLAGMFELQAQPCGSGQGRCVRHRYGGLAM